jgi:sugar/nucleoside kinase (ribokinase family)
LLLSSRVNNKPSRRANPPVADIITVGHLCIDSITLPNRQRPINILGGSSTYVSLAARRLDSRVGIISRIGNDFPEAYKWWLQQEGIDLTGVIKTEGAHTTSYELKYNEDLTDRTLRLRTVAPPIQAEDIPKNLKARIIHIAPIAHEIAPETAEQLRTSADVLSLDPQGLVRHFDADGNVNLQTLTDKHVLELIDIYKSSQQEIEVTTGQKDLDQAIKTVHDLGPKIVIITKGEGGATVSVEGAAHEVPACKPEKLVDPTGAGDAFIGGFLAEYAQGEDLAWCSHVGAAAASLVVEGIGPTFFGDRQEIYRRAHLLYSCSRTRV